MPWTQRRTSLAPTGSLSVPPPVGTPTQRSTSEVSSWERRSPPSRCVPAARACRSEPAPELVRVQRRGQSDGSSESSMDRPGRGLIRSHADDPHRRPRPRGRAAWSGADAGDPRLVILRVSHLGLCVADLERSLRFYCEGLGFREASGLDLAGEPSATLLELPGVALRARWLERDGVRLELLHYPSPGASGDGRPRAMNALGFTHLSFRVAELDAAVARLEALGGRSAGSHSRRQRAPRDASRLRRRPGRRAPRAPRGPRRPGRAAGRSALGGLTPDFAVGSPRSGPDRRGPRAPPARSATHESSARVSSSDQIAGRVASALATACPSAARA